MRSSRCSSNENSSSPTSSDSADGAEEPESTINFCRQRWQYSASSSLRVPHTWQYIAGQPSVTRGAPGDSQVRPSNHGSRRPSLLSSAAPIPTQVTMVQVHPPR